jgi:5-methylcytosine-specific restriction endonuclease McrA
MSRGHGTDIPATHAAQFIDHRSKVDLNGRLFLYGEDWHRQVFKVAERDGYVCQLCKIFVDLHTQTGDAHHVIHRGHGGSDDLDNLMFTHRFCHDTAHPEKQPRWSGKQRAEEPVAVHTTPPGEDNVSTCESTPGAGRGDR